MGDGARLHQVLANLLANARTHTPPGTTVTTSIAVDGAHAALRVTDDGPGIAADLLPEVFDRFSRGDTSRSRAAGSTGLGLAIVAAVVAAHDGSVEATSEPGRTAFTVRLPTAPANASAPPTASPPRTRWTRLAVVGLLLATAALYLWGLGASGWANSYYTAAAQAGA